MHTVFDWLRSRVGRAQTGPATAQDKHLAQTQFELGNQQLTGQNFEAAEHHYRRALAIHPDFAEACCNLGSLLKDRGQLAEADQWLSQAIALKSDLTPAHFNLAMMRIDQGRWTDAASLLQHLLVFSPNEADAHYWLGNALTGSGDVAGARKAYLAAVRLKPEYVQARWGNAMAQLPVVPQSILEQSQAPKAFARELGKLQAKLMDKYASTGHLAVGAQQPYFLAYIAENHRAVLSTYGTLCAKLMAVWAGKVGVPRPAPRHPGKCRIGIVSAHVHSHSVWHALVRGWVEHLDPSLFEIQIFHTGRLRDTETDWASRRVKKLHYGLGNWTNWAEAVSDANLDVLIYPEIGMDATTIRLSALRMARVQLAAWGHPMTTGLPTMDAYISAEAFESSAAEGHYSENLITLPRLGCSYEPFKISPGQVNLSEWGILPSDRVLLCAGTPFKYAPQHDAVLVEIVRRCQPCKLVFFRSEPKTLSHLLEQRLRTAFEVAGFDFDASVVFIPWQPQSTFFALLDRTDVYLDTIGFSGFNTTMQAVERATPIVAFEGEFMRGRFASAVLRQMELDEWVATSTDQFVERVGRLVLDPTARALLKAQMHARRAQLFGDSRTVDALGRHVLRLNAV